MGNVTYEKSDKELLRNQQELYARSKGGHLACYKNYQENYYAISVIGPPPASTWEFVHIGLYSDPDNPYHLLPIYNYDETSPGGPDPSNVLIDRQKPFFWVDGTPYLYSQFAHIEPNATYDGVVYQYAMPNETNDDQMKTGMWDDTTDSNKPAIFQYTATRPHNKPHEKHSIRHSLTDGNYTTWSSDYYIAKDTPLDISNTYCHYDASGNKRYYHKLRVSLTNKIDVSSINLHFINEDNNLSDGFDLYVCPHGIKTPGNTSGAIKKTITYENTVYDCSQIDLYMTNHEMDATPVNTLGLGTWKRLQKPVVDGTKILIRQQTVLETGGTTGSDYPAEISDESYWISENITYDGVEFPIWTTAGGDNKGFFGVGLVEQQLGEVHTLSSEGGSVNQVLDDSIAMPGAGWAMKYKIVTQCSTTIQISVASAHSETVERFGVNNTDITNEGVTHLGIQILSNGNIIYYKKKGANAPKEQLAVDTAGMPGTSYKAVCYIVP